MEEPEQHTSWPYIAANLYCRQWITHDAAMKQ